MDIGYKYWIWGKIYANEIYVKSPKTLVAMAFRLRDFHSLLSLICGFVILIPLLLSPEMFRFLETPLAQMFGLIKEILTSYSLISGFVFLVAIIVNLWVSVSFAFRMSTARHRRLMVTLSLFPTVFATEAFCGLFFFRHCPFIKFILESVREFLAGVYIVLYMKAILIILGDKYADQDLVQGLRRDGLFFRFCFPFTDYMWFPIPVTQCWMWTFKSLISLFVVVRIYLPMHNYYMGIDVKWRFFSVSHAVATVSLCVLDMFHKAFIGVLATHREVLCLRALETIFMICLFQEPLLQGVAGLGLFDADPELQHDVHYVLVIVEMICMNAYQSRDLILNRRAAYTNLSRDDPPAINGPDATQEPPVSNDPPASSDGSDDINSLLVPLLSDKDEDVLPYNLMLPRLETLCTDEETLVRKNAVDLLCVIGSQMSESEVVEVFVPLIKRLAAGELITGRISACKLFHIPYHYCSETLKTELRSTYRQLCQDDMPLVRSSAATYLLLFAATMDPVHLETDVTQIIECLKDDDEESVRLPAVEGFAEFAKLLVERKDFAARTSTEDRRGSSNAPPSTSS